MEKKKQVSSCIEELFPIWVTIGVLGNFSTLAEAVSLISDSSTELQLHNKYFHS